MYIILGISWFVIGIIQFAAIVSGFQDALGFIGVPLAFILAEIPILGTIMGIRGAMNNWGWNFLPSLLLFFGLPVLMVLIALVRSRIGKD